MPVVPTDPRQRVIVGRHICTRGEGFRQMTHRLPRRPRARHALAFAAALAVAAGGSLVAVSSSSAKSKSSSCSTLNTLRTGEAPALAYAPPQLAQTQGDMLKYCLQLQESPVSGASVLLAEIEAGQADIALLNPAGIIQAEEAGIKLKIIAPNTGPGDFAICVAKNSPITKLSQLAGKTVATSLLGSNTDIAFRVRLARAGVNLKGVKFVQILTQSLIPDIVNGVVAAGQCNEPGLTENLSGLRIIDQDPMKEVFGKNTPVTYTITTAAFAASHRLIVQDYQKAYLSMAMAAAKNPQIVRGAAVSFDGTPANVANKMRLPALPTTYAFNQLWTQVQTLVRYGAIKQPISKSALKALFVPLPKIGK